jgi:hypothetical protein
MLTVLDAISMAGDRAKQNDDVCGARANLAWVIDGATDLHDAPLAGQASDAAWLAGELNSALGAGVAREEAGLRALLREASRAAEAAFADRAPASEPWMKPIASALVVIETDGVLTGLDLGDCRVFALGADGTFASRGGPPNAADAETSFVTKIAKGSRPPDGALWRTPDVLKALRQIRARQVTSTAEAAVFSLDPACADAARAWRIDMQRPGHVLLATDGFAALADRYGAYDPAGLVRAAVARGVADLLVELRGIETRDADSSLHPRFKRSDDATALLLRVS